MTSTRKLRRAAGRWEDGTRAWATDAGRALAVDLYHGRDTLTRPYQVGVVLDAGEQVWGELPACCSIDPPLYPPPGAARPGDPLPQPPISTWLLTNGRVVGRVRDHLRGWRWENMVGCRVDLTPGAEVVAIDVENGKPPVTWTGPGVAPLAVAAVFRLYGARAMVEHPGLAVLRTAEVAGQPPPDVGSWPAELPGGGGTEIKGGLYW